MKKALLSFMLLFAATAMNAQGIVKGDMDGDGEVTITDVTSAVDVILGKAPKQTISQGGDPYAVDNTLVVGTWKSSGGTSFTLNEDGTTSYFGAATYKFRPYQGTLTLYNASQEPFKAINVNDLTSSYLTIVENGTFTKYTKSDGHDYVDLGLPSGTLWATCNVGASSPEDYGYYFAWGETVPFDENGKTTFDWSTYKWCNSSSSSMTKYCSNSSYGNNGFTDDKTELEPEDDAAYVNWGSAWRMPSIAQYSELLYSNYTTTEWTTQNGVYGRKITSKMEGYEGNSVFLPAAGYRYDSSLYNAGSYGYYWSRTLDSDNPSTAWYLYFYSSYIFPISDGNGRYHGLAVRPVRLPE